MLGLDQLNALAAELLGNPAGLLEAPVFLEAPIGNGLLNAAFGNSSFHTFVHHGTRRKRQSRSSGSKLKYAAPADVVIYVAICAIVLAHLGLLSIEQSSATGFSAHYKMAHDIFAIFTMLDCVNNMKENYRFF